jgi:predicted phage-related endonuclease
LKLLDCHQGDPAWHAARAKHFTASEAPAAAGVSKYTTRAELMWQKATGVAPEPTPQKQALFDKGHAAERAACPIAEEVIGDILFPRTATVEIEGLSLLASMDGMTEPMGDEPRVLWENKLWSEALAEEVRAGQLSPHYTLQLDQQQLVTGARRTLFMVSDGTRERTLWCWYESTPEKRAALLAVWRQFKADLAAYVPKEAAAIVVAAPVHALPSVVVQVTGEIAVRENFAAFEVALKDFLEHRLIRSPKTDQDFADLDLQIKALKNAEVALDAAEAQMLSQVDAVDAAKRTKDMLLKLARDNRLMAEKLLASEKERRKAEIVAGGVKALADHVAALNRRLGVSYMPTVPADFGSAIKGLKSLASMEERISVELARAKIEANSIADRIQVNMQALVAAGDAAHFPDAATLVLKAPDDLRAVIAQRAAEVQRRLDAERERIRAEEQAKAQREVEAAERVRLAAEAEAARAAAVPAPVAAPAAPPPAPPVAPFRSGAAAAAALAPATLNLGEICSRLGFTVTSAFLIDALHVPPAKVDRRASLYTEAQFALICRQLVSHISAMAELYAPVAA